MTSGKVSDKIRNEYGNGKNFFFGEMRVLFSQPVVDECRDLGGTDLLGIGINHHRMSIKLLKVVFITHFLIHNNF